MLAIQCTENAEIGRWCNSARQNKQTLEGSVGMQCASLQGSSNTPALPSTETDEIRPVSSASVDRYSQAPDGRGANTWIQPSKRSDKYVLFCPAALLRCSLLESTSLLLSSSSSSSSASSAAAAKTVPPPPGQQFPVVETNRAHCASSWAKAEFLTRRSG